MNKFLKNILRMLVIKTTPANLAQTSSLKVINGSYKVNNTIITESLKINGEVVIGENTQVKNPMVVNGKLKADHVNFESELFSNGTIVISYAILKDNAHFCGEITSDNCHYFKNLFLCSKHLLFSSSEFNNIIVQKISYIKEVQQLRLLNNSLVNGDITFESGNGEVYLDSSSQIQGKVYGGKKINI